ncbi:hypothetical protein FB451DRAFT_129487 [Mycena latifolia]|nr:hypothetical protein FB451DRAFT_129487 [Mycena latifolia]
MPWDLLPFELVAQIFIHCLPTNELAPLSSEEPPLLLVHVCRSWSEIATMSTPELWTSILVSPSRYRTSRAMVARWIQASGIGPLDIGLHMVDSDDPSFFDPIISLHHRWRVLDIELCDNSLLARAENGFPSLETLILRLQGRLSHRSSRFPQSLLSHSPNLTTVIWKSPLDISLLLPLWPQLTHLRIPDFIIHSMQCRRLLEVCTSLVEFHVKVLDHETTPLPLTHPELRFLDIRAPSGAYLFLRSLTLPKLERLSCNMGFYRLNPIQTAQLVSFFERSGHLLQSLALCDTYIESGEAVFLLESLPVLPLLRELSILPSGSFDARCSAFSESAFHLSDALFQALASGHLLPDLQHIVFHSCVGFTDAAFVDMVCARWRAIPRLRTVDVGLDHAVEATQLERLRACRDAGLDFPHWGVLEHGPRTSQVRREVVLVTF